ncbi:MAG: Hpt domain-containing protein [Pseudomonadota bacterium]
MQVPAHPPPGGTDDTSVITILTEELGSDTVALLLDSYCEETDAILATLLAGADASAQAEYFHAIRGSALNLGMTALAALAARLERRAIGGEIVGEANIRLLGRLSGEAVTACRATLR